MQNELCLPNNALYLKLCIENNMKNFYFQMPSPIAIFYLNDANYLLPIAIQLYQNEVEDNPVGQFLYSLRIVMWLCS